jgi:hypothetical protein
MSQRALSQTPTGQISSRQMPASYKQQPQYKKKQKKMSIGHTLTGVSVIKLFFFVTDDEAQ